MESSTASHGRARLLGRHVLAGAGAALLLIAGVAIGAIAATQGAAPGRRAPSRTWSRLEAGPAQRARAARDLLHAPMAFEANVGQTDPAVRFMAQGGGYALFLTHRSAVLTLAQRPSAGHSAVLRMSLAGARTSTRLRAAGAMPGRVNYLIGNDRRRWHRGVPSFARVRYAQAWRGIDTVFHGSQSALEYDFHVAPGADPRQIGLRISGAAPIISPDGSLLLRLPAGPIRQLQPRAYQIIRGVRRPVDSRYVVRSGVVRIETGAYDHRVPLIIDPLLIYSSYLGGNRYDGAVGIATDSAGEVFVTGNTQSTNFPGATNSPKKTFVSKFNPDGTLGYSTYLGGSGPLDQAYGVAVPRGSGSGSAAYVTGYTRSSDFPSAPPGCLTGSACTGAAYVAKIASDGSIAWSRYLGVNGDTEGYAIAASTDGSVSITGTTSSSGLSTDATTNAGNGDAFVARYDETTGAIGGATYLGGSGNDMGTGIAVDDNGGVYVTGNTNSVALNGSEGESAGGPYVFAAKLNTSLVLLKSTILSDSGTSSNPDRAAGIAVQPVVNSPAWITGEANAPDFPTTSGAFMSSGGAASHTSQAFVAKLDPTNLSPATSGGGWSTLLGGPSGSQYTSGYAIAVDSSGDAYVTGVTAATDFPVTAAPYQSTNASSFQVAFVTRLAPDGGSLVYSTYLGGTSGFDYGYGIALAPGGQAWVAGSTGSTDFPTTSNAYQRTQGDQPPGAYFDAFVSELDVRPAVAPAITSSSATRFPSHTAGTFTITTTGHPDPTLTHDPGDVLPAGLTFHDNGNGTATVSEDGTSPSGVYTLRLTASNGAGAAATQNLTILIGDAPIITSADHVTFTAGAPGTFTVTTSGSPPPSLSVSDPSQLPAGVTFHDNGDGTGTLSGTPAAAGVGNHAFVFRAQNPAGAYGQSFIVSVVGGAPPVPAPVLGQTVVVGGFAGAVYVKLPGADTFVLLTGPIALPAGTLIDTSRPGARVTLISAADAQGHTQSADFSGAVFRVGYVFDHGTPITELTLTERPVGCPASSGASAAKAAKVPHLFGNGHGKFRTTGHYSSATVRGTAWDISDDCDGTLTNVTRGVVTVQDFVDGQTQNIHEGGQYLALTPPTGKQVNVEPSYGTVSVLPSGAGARAGAAASSGLTLGRKLPLGSHVDATTGALALTTPAGQGKHQTSLMYGGAFRIGRGKGSGGVPVSQLTLLKPPLCRAHGQASVTRAKVPHLWGNAHGHFRTVGHSSSATVRGTLWEVRDYCHGTLTRVLRGVVKVHDFASGRTVMVRAGRHYFARARRRGRARRH